MTDKKNNLTTFLEFIIDSIIDKDEYQLVESQSNNELVQYQLKINPVKAGLIIGKQGKTINAIRRLLQIKASQEKLRVFLQVISDQEDNQPSAQESEKEVSPETETNNETQSKVDELAELIED